MHSDTILHEMPWGVCRPGKRARHVDRLFSKESAAVMHACRTTPDDAKRASMNRIAYDQAVQTPLGTVGPMAGEERGRASEEKCSRLQMNTANATALKLAVNFETTIGTIMLLSTLAIKPR